MNNVKAFGAAGDGKSNDTKAIQRAIDAGGMVYIPGGVYVTGTLFLKSNGGLHLAPDAVLRASHRREDYNPDDFCPQNQVFSAEQVTGAHLITAVEQENIVLSGTGRIEGDAFFWMREKCADTPAWKPNPERPGQMIYFCECRKIRISDVHLNNASYWHLFLHGCEEVRISGLRITGDPLLATNDGIDVDCCSNVVIRDCIIHTGDDAITLRGNDLPLKRKRICEHVQVSNCILSSFNDNAVRVGVGNGSIRNCSFENLVIEGSRTGICLISRFSPTSLGTFIEDLSFRNLRIEAKRPFNIKLLNVEGQEPLKEFRYIRNISFSHLSGTGELTSNILGAENGCVSGLRFQDVEFAYSGIGERPYWSPERMWGYDSKDCAIRVKCAERIHFDNVRIRWMTEHPGWKYDLSAEHSCAVLIRNCIFPKGVRSDNPETIPAGPDRDKSSESNLNKERV